MTNSLAERFAGVMKQDWDARAREDACWYINTLRRRQSEEEFDRTGAVEVERLVAADLRLLARGRDPRHLRLLEIGCGAGRMTRHLAALFGAVTGIDVSGEMIRQARERLRDAPNVQLHETNGVDFANFPDGSFDLILSAYVFQHVPDAEVIASNVSEAWRVLAPGGVFKFQTSGVTAADFETVEKNTWSGAPFPEARIRAFAREAGAQLLGIFGAGTQYCWTLLRKRLTSVTGGAGEGRPRIELHGRTTEAANPRIPAGGDHASLTLIASGLDGEQADCNSISVVIRDCAVPARYVGPVGRNFDAAVRAAFGDSFAHLTQIEIGVPAGTGAGWAAVQVRAGNGELSDAVQIEFEAGRDRQPRIGSIMNVHDDGLELDASGPRSRIRVLIEGLDEQAAADTLRVQIGECVLTPLHVGYLPGNAVHEMLAQLPEGIEPGTYAARVHINGLPSPPVEVVIR
jgi:SAM-dependent methyltransferase